MSRAKILTESLRVKPISQATVQYSNLPLNMFWVSSCVETAKFGAIVVVESNMDGKMPEFACPILGFR